MGLGEPHNLWNCSLVGLFHLDNNANSGGYNSLVQTSILKHGGNWTNTTFLLKLDFTNYTIDNKECLITIYRNIQEYNLNNKFVETLTVSIDPFSQPNLIFSIGTDLNLQVHCNTICIYTKW